MKWAFQSTHSKQIFYPTVQFALAWVLLTSRVMLKMDLGLKFSPNLSAESLQTYRIYLCLLCCKGFGIPILVFSEKSPPSKILRDLWNKATVVRVFWNYYFTAGQKNVGTLQDFQSKFIEFLGFFRWPLSPTILSNLYSVSTFFFSVQELKYLCNNMNYLQNSKQA